MKQANRSPGQLFHYPRTLLLFHQPHALFHQSVPLKLEHREDGRTTHPAAQTRSPPGGRKVYTDSISNGVIWGQVLRSGRIGGISVRQQCTTDILCLSLSFSCLHAALYTLSCSFVCLDQEVARLRALSALKRTQRASHQVGKQQCQVHFSFTTRIILSYHLRTHLHHTPLDNHPKASPVPSYVPYFPQSSLHTRR